MRHGNNVLNVLTRHDEAVTNELWHGIWSDASSTERHGRNEDNPDSSQCNEA